ncbi:MAG TPA: arginine--tRNA ligase [Dissulfurispiraceae bacterium]|nr:arginine--tRNA ligase [Dissulfurispiraceae bacterium]
MERQLRAVLQDACTSLNTDVLVDVIDIQVPKEEFGDLSTPLAMGLAKPLRKSPRAIAEQIVKAVSASPLFERVEIAGPGFINFTFSKRFLVEELLRLIDEPDAVLREDIGGGKRIQIEFVSANPTGPLHLGHGRGAALGAALSNVLQEAGYSVEKEFYINDAGRQVRMLGFSVYAKYQELLGRPIPFPEDGYRGDYITGIAQALLAEHGDAYAGKAFDDVAGFFVEFAYLRMLDAVKQDLTDFGVLFDSWQSERQLYADNLVVQGIDDLKQRGHLFDQDGALWFRSTDFGDDKDRVLVKQDGAYTYFTPDIAYHRKKFEKGFDEIIDIWGADHHGYIPRMSAAVQALGHPKESFRVLLVQLVSLLKGGQQVQMSKRAGEFITLREIMDEIGPDTTKFLFLTRRSDTPLEIDIEIAKAQSNENPVFYVQYAHARINSIFEKAREAGAFTGEAPAIRDSIDFSLYNEDEYQLIKKLLLYPMMFRGAALAREPHRITFYLQELAGMFHPYYHRFRVITDDAPTTAARLLLCQAVKVVLRRGLKMLGVQAPERM